MAVGLWEGGHVLCPWSPGPVGAEATADPLLPASPQESSDSAHTTIEDEDTRGTVRAPPSPSGQQGPAARGFPRWGLRLRRVHWADPGVDRRQAAWTRSPVEPGVLRTGPRRPRAPSSRGATNSRLHLLSRFSQSSSALDGAGQAVGKWEAAGGAPWPRCRRVGRREPHATLPDALAARTRPQDCPGHHSRPLPVWGAKAICALLGYSVPNTPRTTEWL